MDRMAFLVVSAVFPASEKRRRTCDGREACGVRRNRREVGLHMADVGDMGFSRRPIAYPGDEEGIEELFGPAAEGEEEEMHERMMKAKLMERGEEKDEAIGAEKWRGNSLLETGFDKSQRDKDYKVRAGEIPVRFTNLPTKQDIVTCSQPGTNLLKLADSSGIRIPRGCRTGLCGACTVDLEDPSFPDGVQTIRACQTSVLLPDGCDEMVIDLHRMLPSKKEQAPKNPFARFDELDTQYKAAAAPRSNRGGVPTSCETCEGTGKHICPECLGEGVLSDGYDAVCPICFGRLLARCADCQGTGSRAAR